MVLKSGIVNFPQAVKNSSKQQSEKKVYSDWNYDKKLFPSNYRKRFP